VPSMVTIGKQKNVVGLDLESGSIAATEVHANGGLRVSAAGVHRLPSGIVREGEVVDPNGLAAALKEMFAANKLGKQVRLGVANQRVVVRVVRFPALEDEKELETAIRFQAQEHIPMPLDQSVLEWQVVGRSTGENGESFVDVVLVAARRDMISPLVETVRKAGLKPVGVDLSAFAMIRALSREVSAGDQAVLPSYEERMAAPDGTPAAVVPGTLYCNLGDVTNLAVAQGTTCLFTRVSQFGIEGIAQRLAERGELTLDHARQWLTHVGLTTPTESIEGDPETVAVTREVLGEGASKLVDELRLSIEYFGAQEGAVAVEAVVACGSGTTIPGLTERIERELGMPVVAPRPQALAHLDVATSARLTLAYGLSLES
jgi:type IV pilus assembly protein PilM